MWASAKRTTIPQNNGGLNLCTLTFDSTKFSAEFMTQLEEILYGKDPTTTGGNDGVEPRLPLPDEIIELFDKTQNPEG